MKILYVQKEGGIFGAENYHLHIIPSLIKQGVTIEFLRLYTHYQLGVDSDFVKRLRAIGIVVYQVNIGRIPWINDIHKVAGIMRQGSYDIIHSHLIHADLYSALIKIIYKLPSVFISTKHGYDNAYTAKYGFNHHRVRSTLYYWLSRGAEAVMDKSYTISKGLLEFFVDSSLTTRGKMELIYYGFDLPVVPEVSNTSDYRIAKHQLCIAGRLVEFKGHTWAIQALAILKEKYNDVRLVIIGTGKHKIALEEIAKNLNVSQQIEWLGYRNDVVLWMHYSDVVLIPSRSEGFGVVFLEAFNAGTPVVAFNVAAANELIRHEENGLLAHPYSEHELAICIDRLLQDRELAKKLSFQAASDLHEKFSLSIMTKATLTFYKQRLQK